MIRCLFSIVFAQVQVLLMTDDPNLPKITDAICMRLVRPGRCDSDSPTVKSHRIFFAKIIP